MHKMADHEYIERRLEAMGDEALINIKKAITISDRNTTPTTAERISYTTRPQPKSSAKL
jgi:hypothetical protein